MRHLARFLLIAILATCALASDSNLAQQPKQSGSDYLLKKGRRFFDYSNDFLAFARTKHNDDLEFEIALNLCNTASTDGEYINTMQTLLEIYQQLSCQADKGMAWSIIRQNRDYYVLQIANDIKGINLEISQSKVPAVAALGTQMKDDLREMKTFLESLRAN